MADPATWVYISTALSAAGQIKQGQDADKIAGYKASQLKQRAGQERAVSQRKASAQRRQAGLAQSRVLALAAASGAGASDKTVVDIMGGIFEQGELSAGYSLYEGEERARGSSMAADTATSEGKQAKRAGYIGATSTIMSGAGSAYSMKDKYSPDNLSSGLAN